LGSNGGTFGSLLSCLLALCTVCDCIPPIPRLA
jgi:hypothetical protein